MAPTLNPWFQLDGRIRIVLIFVPPVIVLMYSTHLLIILSWILMVTGFFTMIHTSRLRKTFIFLMLNYVYLFISIVLIRLSVGTPFLGAFEVALYLCAGFVVLIAPVLLVWNLHFPTFFHSIMWLSSTIARRFGLRAGLMIVMTANSLRKIPALITLKIKNLALRGIFFGNHPLVWLRLVSTGFFTLCIEDSRRQSNYFSTYIKDTTKYRSIHFNSFSFITFVQCVVVVLCTIVLIGISQFIQL